MTVKDVIEKLKGFDTNQEVKIQQNEIFATGIKDIIEREFIESIANSPKQVALILVEE